MREVLTELGRTLLEPVSALATWADRHRASIQQARDEFDARGNSQPVGRAVGS